MNNDLERLSEERLKELSNINGDINTRFCDADIEALARIAISAKQAKPVYQIEDADGWHDCEKEEYLSLIKSQGIPDVYCRVLFTTPQPAHTEQVIKITQVMLDAAVADYCTNRKYTVENIPYELRRQVELEAEFTFKAMLAAAPKPESER